MIGVWHSLSVDSRDFLLLLIAVVGGKENVLQRALTLQSKREKLLTIKGWTLNLCC